MKKVFMFLCCIYALNVSGAFADCQPLACGNTDSWNAPQKLGEVGDQCWFCGPGPRSCGQKDMVPFKNAADEIVHLYRCMYDVTLMDVVWNFDKKGRWEQFDPNDVCSDSPVRTYGVAHTHSVIHMESSKQRRFESYVYYNDGAVGCWYITCEKGYKANREQTECIPEDEYDCSAAGGKWNNGSCDCSQSGEFLEWDAGAKKCVDKTADERSACIKSAGEGAWIDSKKTCDCTKKGENYEWNKKSCELNQAGKDLENARASCTKTGGTWFGSSCVCNKPHMKDLVKGKTCQCESNVYKFNSDKRACEIDDTEQLRQNCEKAAKNANSGVEGWDGVSKCICKQSNEMYNFDGVSKCVQDERYKLCAAKSNEAYWNHNEDKCVCTDKDFEWNYNRCDKKGEVVIAENEANAKKQITTLVDGLKTKFASFKKSVWKDKEGNFNKARLASDSIAGVVLGTAGGLITSKVVKKNQVKSGFEDINCVIGGQKVADYGDEFTVGIK